MDEALRAYFDEQLEAVLEKMPPMVHDLLDRVPLYVEDYPSEAEMRRVGVHRRELLCGLYTGIPLTFRTVDQSGVLSDVIRLYREGILRLASRRNGVDEKTLREQIRITLLHELGHHHGLTETDLQELGYG